MLGVGCSPDRRSLVAQRRARAPFHFDNFARATILPPRCMTFRSSIAAGLFFAALALAGARAMPAAEATSNVEIVCVWTAYREARSFIRLSEYFDGKENTGGAIVL